MRAHSAGSITDTLYTVGIVIVLEDVHSICYRIVHSGISGKLTEEGESKANGIVA
jgi:hypothetical protein